MSLLAWCIMVRTFRVHIGSAAEMLEALKQRMPNELSEELRVAAAEQAKITRIRLEKLEL